MQAELPNTTAPFKPRLMTRLGMAVFLFLVALELAFAQQPPLARQALSRQDAYIESAVQMAALMATATAGKTWGDCVGRMYFGSAFASRDLTAAVWLLEKQTGVDALTDTLIGACGRDQKPAATPRSWDAPLPQGSATLKDNDPQVTVEASLHVSASVARAAGLGELGLCIEKLYRRLDVMNAIAEFGKQNGTPTLYHLVYGYLRQNCEALISKPDWKSVSFSEAQNTEKAAAERLLAVADRTKCLRNPDEGIRPRCIDLLDKLRRADIATYLALQDNEQQLRDARRKLEDTRPR
jgi:hypothetical protein